MRRRLVLALVPAGTLVVAGGLCAAFVGGLAGELLTICLISLGLLIVVGLAFLEFGLSEDAELAREAARRRDDKQREKDRDRARWRLRRGPRRPG